MAILEIRNILKNFGAVKAVDGVSLQVSRGEKVVIIGPSGSGKSTLLRCLNGLEKIDSGEILIDGQVVDFGGKHPHLHRAEIGMVFQSFELFPHLNVLQNLILAQKVVRNMPLPDAKIVALDYLEKVGLTDKAESSPNQISGGQKQRVAIARALCLKPKLMLFDEPTSALDPEMIAEVLNVMRQLAKDGTTMIVVSHEIGFAREIADTVVFYENGKIIEHGPAAEILDTASHPRTIEFLSKVLQ